MKVDLIDRMGSDLTVVNAARVSFDKESDWVYKEHEEISDGGKTIDIHKLPSGLQNKDKRLISFLAREGHWSPFAHCFVQFRIKAPIFVARQLVKHQVGLSWNEVSRRYVDSEPEFYTPSTWRKRAEDKKQGSSKEAVSNWQSPFDLHSINDDCEILYQDILTLYREMLHQGVCPEQARMVLPQSMMTEWYWSGSLFAFARVCRERLAPDAQQETREVAQQIAQHCERLFPVCWKELVSGPKGQG